jgi:ADP-heptose:LPS heptosyltransferase
VKIKAPESVFVLRNNDLGDVLLTTPLLHGLRKAFPSSKISIGVGDWAKDLLLNNPDIDQVHYVNAPWHNKQNCRYPANSPRTFLEGLLYVLLSKDVRILRKEAFSHGIDVLGSRQGSWLLLSACIPSRYGVKGYAGGHGWCKAHVDFREDRNVSQAALKFLGLMDANCDVEPRPKIFLSDEEIKWGERRWEENNAKGKRIVISPGSGFPEKNWGNEHYTALAKMIADTTSHGVLIVGDASDRDKIKLSGIVDEKHVKCLCGETSIRETAAIIRASNLTITNSSVAMHIAAAFVVPTIVCLGKAYNSAKLHHSQWGYPESTVLGKETSIQNNELPTPLEIFEMVSSRLLYA